MIFLYIRSTVQTLRVAQGSATGSRASQVNNPHSPTCATRLACAQGQSEEGSQSQSMHEARAGHRGMASYSHQSCMTTSHMGRVAKSHQSMAKASTVARSWDIVEYISVAHPGRATLSRDCLGLTRLMASSRGAQPTVARPLAALPTVACAPLLPVAQHTPLSIHTLSPLALSILSSRPRRRRR